MEIFVIYNKITGFIEGGSSKIDKQWDAAHADGSTMSARIPQILAKDSNREVIYLPDQTLPDPGKHKIQNGEIADLTEADKKEIEDARPESKTEEIEKRIKALENKLG